MCVCSSFFLDNCTGYSCNTTAISVHALHFLHFIFIIFLGKWGILISPASIGTICWPAGVLQVRLYTTSGSSRWILSELTYRQLVIYLPQVCTYFCKYFSAPSLSLRLVARRFDFCFDFVLCLHYWPIIIIIMIMKTCVVPVLDSPRAPQPRNDRMPSCVNRKATTLSQVCKEKGRRMLLPA